jgi:hypothetical protein
VNGNGLIPRRKENRGGVLKVESELPQLSLNIRKQGIFFYDYKDGQTFANIDLAG